MQKSFIHAICVVHLNQVQILTRDLYLRVTEMYRVNVVFNCRMYSQLCPSYIVCSCMRNTSDRSDLITKYQGDWSRCYNNSYLMAAKLRQELVKRKVRNTDFGLQRWTSEMIYALRIEGIHSSMVQSNRTLWCSDTFPMVLLKLGYSHEHEHSVRGRTRCPFPHITIMFMGSRCHICRSLMTKFAFNVMTIISTRAVTWRHHSKRDLKDANT